MFPLPLGTAAVVVVGEDLVVVYVTTREQGAPTRTAHRRRHVSVSQLRALVPYATQHVRHKVQRTCTHSEEEEEEEEDYHRQTVWILH